MSELHVLASGAEHAHDAVLVRKISIADIFDALRKGGADFLDKPSHYVFVIVIYPIIGLTLFFWASHGNMLQLVYPLVTGFALLGPIAALGRYEISRRRELGLESSWNHAFDVLHSSALPAIAAVAILLVALFLAWLFTAQFLFDRLFGDTRPESMVAFFYEVIGTSRGWMLLVLGNAIGFVFALVTLCMTAVAFPLLLDREVGAMMAVATSLRVVRKNPVPMLFWGLIVAGLLFLGALPGLAGLIVVLPLLGHATWHVYRKTVVHDEATLRPVSA